MLIWKLVELPSGKTIKKRRATVNPNPESEVAPRYCVKHMSGLILKLQKVDTSRCSEIDCRRQNLEEIVSKIAGDVDANAHTIFIGTVPRGGLISKLQ